LKKKHEVVINRVFTRGYFVKNTGMIPMHVERIEFENKFGVKLLNKTFPFIIEDEVKIFFEYSPNKSAYSDFTNQVISFITS